MLFDGDSRERMEKFGSIGGRGVGWPPTNGELLSTTYKRRKTALIRNRVSAVFI